MSGARPVHRLNRTHRLTLHVGCTMCPGVAKASVVGSAMLLQMLLGHAACSSCSGAVLHMAATPGYVLQHVLHVAWSQSECLWHHPACPACMLSVDQLQNP